MEPDEQARLKTWVRDFASTYLSDVAPDMITDARPSKAVRLRWFKMRYKGTDYKIGLNIHYGGAFGGLWITNVASDETMEFHPHAAPQHGLGPGLLPQLQHHFTAPRKGHELLHKTKGSYRHR